MGDFIRLGDTLWELSPDFRFATFNRNLYSEQTPRAADVLEIVFEYMERGIPRVHSSTVLNRIKKSCDLKYGEDEVLLTSTKIRTYFVDSPLWGTLIKTTKGRNSYIYFDLNFIPTNFQDN